MGGLQGGVGKLRGPLDVQSHRAPALLIAPTRVLKKTAIMAVTNALPGLSNTLGCSQEHKYRSCFGYEEFHLLGCYAFLRSVLRLLVTATIVPSLLILVILMMEAIRCSEMSVLTKSTRRNITEYGILHSHRCENLQSFIALTVWAL
jgi:hypothetical protein